MNIIKKIVKSSIYFWIIIWVINKKNIMICNIYIKIKTIKKKNIKYYEPGFPSGQRGDTQDVMHIASWVWILLQALSYNFFIIIKLYIIYI